MGVYTCTKPATFAGVRYLPGDTVPAEAIPADRVGAVIRLGLIAEAQPEPPAAVPAPFTVPVTLEDGTVYDVEVTPETVVEAVTILQMTAEGAMGRIKTVTDNTALILVDACDSRKTVKKAAAARAAELEGSTAPGEDGGEEPPADAGENDPEEPAQGEATPPEEPPAGGEGE
ncbi:hypothetical protein [Alistipes sp.]|uniref:hypothetical protein n=1 Tax=Alistipes sp. TaxID=1872444 RepID=UPI0031FD968C